MAERIHHAVALLPVPLLRHPQDAPPHACPCARRLPWRLRHARRAVRDAHARPDREDEARPDRPRGPRLLGEAHQLAVPRRGGRDRARGPESHLLGRGRRRGVERDHGLLRPASGFTRLAAALMAIEYADSHGHLTMVFDGGEMKGAPRAPSAAEVKELVGRARDAGVTRILVPATEPDDQRRTVEIAEANEGVYAAVGFHPHEAKEFDEDRDLKLFEELCASKKVVAVGGIGLD